MSTKASELYSVREIALAAGVSAADVMPLTGSDPRVGFEEAVRIGRALAARKSAQSGTPPPLFSIVSGGAAAHRSKGAPLALSATLHAGVVAGALLATLNLSQTAATLRTNDRPPEPMRLVFLATPGPGGGGGGGGLLQKAPAPKAFGEGHRAISSPIPLRKPPEAIIPAPAEPKPEPPLKAEQLPVVFAAIITAPADARSRIGVLEQTTAANDSHGPGVGGGVGAGAGTGLGEGNGSGVGPGSGGGTGGGPYRPGSGIEPPRLLREVRVDYTEEARQHGVTGGVLLEIVVRRDGSVGDVKLLQGLSDGLNDRAIQAVRQWRFAPARRGGTPVDVVVEVAVEFKLR